MADEVTKKDLQSLQGYCNKAIADSQKQLEAKIAEVQKSADGNYKVIESIQGSANDSFKRYAARLDALEKTVKDLSAAISKQGDAINDLRNR